MEVFAMRTIVFSLRTKLHAEQSHFLALKRVKFSGFKASVVLYKNRPENQLPESNESHGST
jgi:hypothetical protein